MLFIYLLYFLVTICGVHMFIQKPLGTHNCICQGCLWNRMPGS